MTTMRTTSLAMAAAVIATACMTGPSARRFDPVKHGGGAQLKIIMKGKHRADGELIEVRDSGLVVMHICGLQVLPYGSIDKLRVHGYSARYRGGGTPGPGLREDLRLLSRFPAGIPESLRETLGRCATSASRTPASSEATYLLNARRVAGKYASLDTAIAAGYRRIGGDVPSLGEHWVNPAMVMSGRIDPETPSVLIYVRTPEGPTMAGVAWTTVLRAGEPYPDAPVGQAAWHEHNGTVAEETLPMHHHHGAMGSSDPTRIAILHAWVGVENPAGVWVADNWALPYVRAGLRPENVTPVMGRALSLAAPGATSYYVRVVEKSVGEDAQTLERTRVQIDSAAREIIAVTSAASQELTAAQRAHVEATWTSLWERLGQDVQLREVSVAMR